MLSNRMPGQIPQSVDRHEEQGDGRLFPFEVYAGKSGSKSGGRPRSQDEILDARIPSVVSDLAEIFRHDRVVGVRPTAHQSPPPRRGTNNAGTVATGAATAEGTEACQGLLDDLAADAGIDDLACVIESWPALPRSIQVAILTIVQQSAGGAK
jgi:hypothetical protein